MPKPCTVTQTPDICISEKVIQWLWSRMDFHRKHLHTQQHQNLEIKHPGRRNHQEGPDFLNAHLILDGQEIRGDVDIHFDAHDWETHKQTQDPRFRNVVLLVTLFPKKAFFQTQQHPETRMATLSLLPYLHQDIEAYAEDYALALQDTGCTQWLAPLLELDTQQRLDYLHQLARQRWLRKLAHHKALLQQHDLKTVCHLRTLEVLGYSRNRETMLEVATEYPSEKFAQHTCETIFEHFKKQWRLRDVRPANHPLKRLSEYASLIQQKPHWLSDLWYQLGALPRKTNPEASTKTFRKQTRWPHFIRSILSEVLDNRIPESRAHTLISDALLYIYSAHSSTSLYEYWFHGYPGEFGGRFKNAMRTCELQTAENPLCHGYAQALMEYAHTSSRHT